MRMREPADAGSGVSNVMVRDALTGVYAKSALHERLDEEVHRARRYGEAFSVLLLDLNHFKSVNDAFGHARGDATLTEFVTRVQQTARNSDVLFRYGGDEFVLFLPRTTHEQAAMLADRLAAHISNTPFSGQPPLSLSVAIGVATLPDDGASSEDLLSRADMRMYESKRGGPSHIATAEHAQKAETLLQDETRLIERLDVFEAANRFFDNVPAASAGALRITGAPGSGRSRIIAEIEQLARLRRLHVLRVRGSAHGNVEPLSAIRHSSPEAAQLPALLTSTAQLAAALRDALIAAESSPTIVTIDDADTIDPESLQVIRILLRAASKSTAVGLVHVGHEFDIGNEPNLGFYRDTVELRPLSRDGVRAWMRSIFRWEPPPEFVEWVHAQTAGMPKSVRRLLVQLVERQLLVREDGKWRLADGFREIAGYRMGLRRAQIRGLRLPTTPLFGREDSFRQLLRLATTTRLMTLAGPAGCGKTRIALELAPEAADHFDDGVAFVSVSARMSSFELATAIACVFDVESLSGPDPWVSLARQLRHHKVLLILDSVDGVPFIAESLGTLLENASDLHVLAIARHRLTKDEWVFHLEGLRTPKSSDIEAADSTSSVRLFHDRATAANPDLHLGLAEAPSIQRICQLLDGAPLPIELAAALTTSLSCREVCEELAAALGGISAYLPAIPQDEQRSRAALDQTWHVMSESERRALRRASLFAGEFDVDAANAVAQASDAELDRLVTLAVAMRPAPGRYALHPAVREYARQKLDAFAEERQQAITAFAAHYLNLAVTLGEQLRNAPTLHTALSQFILELPNIRKAWTAALVEEQYDLITQAAHAWFAFFEVRPYAADAEALFANALNWIESARGERPVGESLSEILRARHGATLLAVGKIDDARLRLSSALAIAQRMGISSEEALCLRYLALVEHAAGNSSQAEEYARGSIMFARRSDDPHALVMTLRNAAEIAAANSSLQQAVEYLLEAIGVEAPSSGKASAWRALLQAVEPIVSQGAVPLPGTVLAQIVNDRSADPDVISRAQRLLDSLRAIHPQAPDIDAT